LLIVLLLFIERIDEKMIAHFEENTLVKHTSALPSVCVSVCEHE